MVVTERAQRILKKRARLQRWSKNYVSYCKPLIQDILARESLFLLSILRCFAFLLFAFCNLFSFLSSLFFHLFFRAFSVLFFYALFLCSKYSWILLLNIKVAFCAFVVSRFSVSCHFDLATIRSIFQQKHGFHVPAASNTRQ